MDTLRTLSLPLLRASSLRKLFSFASTLIGGVATGLFLALFSAPSLADTIGVTDSDTSTNRASLNVGGQFSNVVAVAWEQDGTNFSDVTIDALVGSVDPSVRSGTAYLMRAIGPGTTSASEVVAPVDFTAPVEQCEGVCGGGSGFIPSTVLFSGLFLRPGTYYLVLSAPSQIQSLHWELPTEPVYTDGCMSGPSLCGSVVLGGAYVWNTTLSPADPFPPASSFGVLAPPTPMFTATGTFTPAPEPSSLFLFCTGLLVMMGAGRRKLLR